MQARTKHAHTRVGVGRGLLRLPVCVDSEQHVRMAENVLWTVQGHVSSRAGTHTRCNVRARRGWLTGALPVGLGTTGEPLGGNAGHRRISVGLGARSQRLERHQREKLRGFWSQHTQSHRRKSPPAPRRTQPDKTAASCMYTNIYRE